MSVFDGRTSNKAFFATPFLNDFEAEQARNFQQQNTACGFKNKREIFNICARGENMWNRSAKRKYNVSKCILCDSVFAWPHERRSRRTMLSHVKANGKQNITRKMLVSRVSYEM